MQLTSSQWFSSPCWFGCPRTLVRIKTWNESGESDKEKEQTTPKRRTKKLSMSLQIPKSQSSRNCYPQNSSRNSLPPILSHISSCLRISKCSIGRGLSLKKTAPSSNLSASSAWFSSPSTRLGSKTSQSKSLWWWEQLTSIVWQLRKKGMEFQESLVS